MDYLNSDLPVQALIVRRSWVAVDFGDLQAVPSSNISSNAASAAFSGLATTGRNTQHSAIDQWFNDCDDAVRLHGMAIPISIFDDPMRFPELYARDRLEVRLEVYSPLAVANNTSGVSISSTGPEWTQELLDVASTRPSSMPAQGLLHNVTWPFNMSYASSSGSTVGVSSGIVSSSTTPNCPGAGTAIQREVRLHATLVVVICRDAAACAAGTAPVSVTTDSIQPSLYVAGSGDEWLASNSTLSNSSFGASVSGGPSALIAISRVAAANTFFLPSLPPSNCYDGIASNGTAVTVCTNRSAGVMPFFQQTYANLVATSVSAAGIPIDFSAVGRQLHGADVTRVAVPLPWSVFDGGVHAVAVPHMSLTEPDARVDAYNWIDVRYDLILLGYPTLSGSAGNSSSAASLVAYAGPGTNRNTTIGPPNGLPPATGCNASDSSATLGMLQACSAAWASGAAVSMCRPAFTAAQAAAVASITSCSPWPGTILNQSQPPADPSLELVTVLVPDANQTSSPSGSVFVRRLQWPSSNNSYTRILDSVTLASVSFASDGYPTGVVSVRGTCIPFGWTAGLPLYDDVTTWLQDDSQRNKQVDIRLPAAFGNVSSSIPGNSAASAAAVSPWSMPRAFCGIDALHARFLLSETRGASLSSDMNDPTVEAMAPSSIYYTICNPAAVSGPCDERYDYWNYWDVSDNSTARRLQAGNSSTNSNSSVLVTPSPSIRKRLDTIGLVVDLATAASGNQSSIISGAGITSVLNVPGMNSSLLSVVVSRVGVGNLMPRGTNATLTVQPSQALPPGGIDLVSSPSLRWQAYEIQPVTVSIVVNNSMWAHPLLVGVDRIAVNITIDTTSISSGTVLGVPPSLIEDTSNALCTFPTFQVVWLCRYAVQCVVAPTATPSATASGTASPPSTSSGTATISVTASGTASPTGVRPTSSASTSVSASPSPTSSASASFVAVPPTPTTTPSRTAAASSSTSATVSSLPSRSSTTSATNSATAIATASSSATATSTATASPTSTSTKSVGASASITPSPTSTPTPSTTPAPILPIAAEVGGIKLAMSVQVGSRKMLRHFGPRLLNTSSFDVAKLQRAFADATGNASSWSVGGLSSLVAATLLPANATSSTVNATLLASTSTSGAPAVALSNGQSPAASSLPFSAVNVNATSGSLLSAYAQSGEEVVLLPNLWAFIPSSANSSALQLIGRGIPVSADTWYLPRIAPSFSSASQLSGASRLAAGPTAANASSLAAAAAGAAGYVDVGGASAFGVSSTSSFLSTDVPSGFLIEVRSIRWTIIGVPSSTVAELEASSPSYLGGADDGIDDYNFTTNVLTSPVGGGNLRPGYLYIATAKLNASISWAFGAAPATWTPPVGPVNGTLAGNSSARGARRLQTSTNSSSNFARPGIYRYSLLDSAPATAMSQYSPAWYVRTPPFGGNLVTDPNNGTAIVTQFQISTAGWMDLDAGVVLSSQTDTSTGSNINATSSMIDWVIVNSPVPPASTKALIQLNFMVRSTGVGSVNASTLLPVVPCPSTAQYYSTELYTSSDATVEPWSRSQSMLADQLALSPRSVCSSIATGIQSLVASLVTANNASTSATSAMSLSYSIRVDTSGLPPYSLPSSEAGAPVSWSETTYAQQDLHYSSSWAGVPLGAVSNATTLSTVLTAPPAGFGPTTIIVIAVDDDDGSAGIAFTFVDVLPPLTAAQSKDFSAVASFGETAATNIANTAQSNPFSALLQVMQVSSYLANVSSVVSNGYDSTSPFSSLSGSNITTTLDTANFTEGAKANITARNTELRSNLLSSISVAISSIGAQSDGSSGSTRGSSSTSSGGVSIDDGTAKASASAIAALTNNPKELNVNGSLTAMNAVSSMLTLALPKDTLLAAQSFTSSGASNSTSNSSSSTSNGTATSSSSGVVSAPVSAFPVTAGNTVLNVITNVLTADALQVAIAPTPVPAPSPAANQSNGGGTAPTSAATPVPVNRQSDTIRAKVTSALSVLSAALLRAATAGDPPVTVAAVPVAGILQRVTGRSLQSTGAGGNATTSDSVPSYCGAGLSMSSARVSARYAGQVQAATAMAPCIGAASVSASGTINTRLSSLTLPGSTTAQDNADDYSTLPSSMITSQDPPGALVPSATLTRLSAGQAPALAGLGLDVQVVQWGQSPVAETAGLSSLTYSRSPAAATTTSRLLQSRDGPVQHQDAMAVEAHGATLHEPSWHQQHMSVSELLLSATDGSLWRKTMRALDILAGRGRTPTAAPVDGHVSTTVRAGGRRLLQQHEGRLAPSSSSHRSLSLMGALSNLLFGDGSSIPSDLASPSNALHAAGASAQDQTSLTDLLPDRPLDSRPVTVSMLNAAGQKVDVVNAPEPILITLPIRDTSIIKVPNTRNSSTSSVNGTNSSTSSVEDEVVVSLANIDVPAFNITCPDADAVSDLISIGLSTRPAPQGTVLYDADGTPSVQLLSFLNLGIDAVYIAPTSYVGIATTTRIVNASSVTYYSEVAYASSSPRPRPPSTLYNPARLGAQAGSTYRSPTQSSPAPAEYRLHTGTAYTLQVDCGPALGNKTLTCGPGSAGITVTFRCPQVVPRPSCLYYDEQARVWTDRGCIVHDTTATSIVCACTHTTEFAARFAALEDAQEDIFAENELLTDVTVFEQYPYVFIITGSIMGVVLLGQCIALRFDRQADSRFYDALLLDEEVSLLERMEVLKCRAFILDRVLDGNRQAQHEPPSEAKGKSATKLAIEAAQPTADPGVTSPASKPPLQVLQLESPSLANKDHDDDVDVEGHARHETIGQLINQVVLHSSHSAHEVLHLQLPSRNKKKHVSAETIADDAVVAISDGGAGTTASAAGNSMLSTHQAHAASASAPFHLGKASLRSPPASLQVSPRGAGVNFASPSAVAVAGLSPLSPIGSVDLLTSRAQSSRSHRGNSRRVSMSTGLASGSSMGAVVTSSKRLMKEITDVVVHPGSPTGRQSEAGQLSGQPKQQQQYLTSGAAGSTEEEEEEDPQIVASRLSTVTGLSKPEGLAVTEVAGKDRRPNPYLAALYLRVVQSFDSVRVTADRVKDLGDVVIRKRLDPEMIMDLQQLGVHVPTQLDEPEQLGQMQRSGSTPADQLAASTSPPRGQQQVPASPPKTPLSFSIGVAGTSYSSPPPATARTTNNSTGGQTASQHQQHSQNVDVVEVCELADADAAAHGVLSKAHGPGTAAASSASAAEASPAAASAELSSESAAPPTASAVGDQSAPVPLTPRSQAVSAAHERAMLLVNRMRHALSVFDTLSHWSIIRAWRMKAFLSRVFCLRLWYHHTILSVLSKFDPRLSRVARLTVIACALVGNMFIVAFWYAFTNGSDDPDAVDLPPMGLAETLVVSWLSTAMSMPIDKLLAFLFTRAGEAEFSWRYPFLWAEMKRRKTAEAKLKKVAKADLEKALTVKDALEGDTDSGGQEVDKPADGTLVHVTGTATPKTIASQTKSEAGAPTQIPPSERLDSPPQRPTAQQLRGIHGTIAAARRHSAALAASSRTSTSSEAGGTRGAAPGRPASAGRTQVRRSSVGIHARLQSSQQQAEGVTPGPQQFQSNQQQQQQSCMISALASSAPAYQTQTGSQYLATAIAVGLMSGGMIAPGVGTGAAASDDLRQFMDGRRHGANAAAADAAHGTHAPTAIAAEGTGKSTSADGDDNGIEVDALAFGWIDAPDDCATTCPSLLRCCGRHSSQKAAFVTRMRDKVRKEAERKAQKDARAKAKRASKSKGKGDESARSNDSTSNAPGTPSSTPRRDGGPAPSNAAGQAANDVLQAGNASQVLSVFAVVSAKRMVNATRRRLSDSKKGSAAATSGTSMRDLPVGSSMSSAKVAPVLAILDQAEVGHSSAGAGVGGPSASQHIVGSVPAVQSAGFASAVQALSAKRGDGRKPSIGSSQRSSELQSDVAPPSADGQLVPRTSSVDGHSSSTMVSEVSGPGASDDDDDDDDGALVTDTFEADVDRMLASRRCCECSCNRHAPSAYGCTMASVVAYTTAWLWLLWCLYYLILFGLAHGLATTQSFVIAWGTAQANSLLVVEPAVILGTIVFSFIIWPSWLPYLVWIPGLGRLLGRKAAGAVTGDATSLTGRFDNLTMVRAAGHASQLSPENAVIAFGVSSAMSAAIDAVATRVRRRKGKPAAGASVGAAQPASTAGASTGDKQDLALTAVGMSVNASAASDPSMQRHDLIVRRYLLDQLRLAEWMRRAKLGLGAKRSNKKDPISSSARSLATLEVDKDGGAGIDAAGGGADDVAKRLSMTAAALTSPAPPPPRTRTTAGTVQLGAQPDSDEDNEDGGAAHGSHDTHRTPSHAEIMKDGGRHSLQRAEQRAQYYAWLHGSQSFRAQHQGWVDHDGTGGNGSPRDEERHDYAASDAAAMAAVAALAHRRGSNAAVSKAAKATIGGVTSYASLRSKQMNRSPKTTPPPQSTVGAGGGSPPPSRRGSPAGNVGVRHGANPSPPPSSTTSPPPRSRVGIHGSSSTTGRR